VSGAVTRHTIAVTGAGGFLGGRLVSRLAAERCRIIRAARTTLPPITGSAATVIDVVGDLSDRAAWDQLAGAEIIFHLAAQTSAAVAEADVAADFIANVTPMRHLLAACRQDEWHPTVVFAGTVTEAGISSRTPVNEDEPDRPITVYDRHKLAAEGELKAAAREGTVRGCTLRLANVFGPGTAGRSDRGVLNRMIAEAVRGRPLPIYGTGSYVRDYVFVEDVVDAFLMAASHPEQVNGRHFVIGSGRGVSIRDAFELVAARVEARTGRRVPVISAPSGAPLSPIDERNFVADASRFSAATGWRAACTLSDGIDRTIEWLI
jgi:nucleoside-diphosphate-sugar epimerase